MVLGNCGEEGQIVAALSGNLNPVCRHGPCPIPSHGGGEAGRAVSSIVSTVRFAGGEPTDVCLFGLSGIFSGLAAMAISPFAGFLVLLYSIASVLVGIVFSRIVAEFILIVFRINEHLGAIRDQGGMR
jgi:hypothetical protein